MAGSTFDPRTTTSGRVWKRCLAVAVGVAMAGLLAGPAAQAQVPAIPDAPEVPPEVTAALEQVEDLVIPVLVDGAIQAQAVSNALGFGLRPACAGAGTAVLLVVIAGGSLPVSPGFISTPLLIFCAGAFSPGPADPVFDIVDEQAGSTLASNVNPVLKQLRDALAPVRPNTTDACGVIALAGSTPRQVPPPLNRFNLVRLVC